MRKHKIFRVLGILSALLTTLFLCLWIFVIALLTTVHRPTFVNTYIDEDYCHAAYEELMTKWAHFGEPAQIPPEVFRDALPETQLTSEILLHSESVWSGAYNYKFRFEEVGNQLMEAFTQYAKDQGVPESKELTEALTTLKDTCLEQYPSYARVPVLNTLGKLVRSTRTATEIAFYALLGLLLITSVTTVLLHQYWFHGLRDHVYALFAAALVLAPPSLWVIGTNPVMSLALEPRYLRFLINRLVEQSMWQALWFAVLLAVVGLLLLVVVEIASYRRFHTYTRRHGRVIQHHSSHGGHHHRHARHWPSDMEDEEETPLTDLNGGDEPPPSFSEDTFFHP